MNKNYLYLIKDVVAGVWKVPFFEINDNTACRAFRKYVSEQYIGNSCDFQLFKTAEYDCLTGIVTGFSAPEFIEQGVDDGKE